jgi:diguanylate cyclase (GGDEF)-like protein
LTSDEALSDVLGEFARTMLTDFPIQAILDHLVTRIVDVLPIAAAGVTLISPGAYPRYVAASDESALRFEELQTELGEGPCLAAYQTGAAVAVPDLRAEPRFPVFAPRALEAGLVAVFTFPLRHGEEQMGALDLYRNVPGSLDSSAMVAAQTLADVAAAYLLNARARDDLQDALHRSRAMAVHDPLTGLPNRVLLFDRLDHALARRDRRPSTTALLFIDIDRFKAINDSLGHSGGDRFLVEMAARLQAAVRLGDTVARFGGDEFVVLCEDFDVLRAAALAERLAKVIATPFAFDGRQIVATLSIGVAFAPATGDASSTALLRDADAAMYRAKAAGRDRYEIFDAEMRTRAQEHLETAGALRHAIGRREFVVFYQPEVNLTTGDVIGVEALVRWQHPQRGCVAPGEFIPLAEETGLIVPLGAFVLEEACRQVAGWRRRSPSPLMLSLAVNLSARQLLAPDLSNIVRDALATSGLTPSSLCLEITESVLLDDAQASAKVLEALKAIGVRIAVDDFGTGYSSLIYLKRFPVDVLKIDKSFIDGLVDDRQDRAIVSSVVDLARAFGLTTIGEGVETAEQLALLRALGCEAAQGHLWSPALPPDELERWAQGVSVMAPSDDTAAGSTPTGVLIVEDDASLRKMLRLLFDGAAGYFVVGEADDGREALSLAAHYQPGLVLLDLAMPGMGGLEALPLILGVAPHAKIVVLTGSEAVTMADTALSRGAAAYFEKGLDPTVLLDYLTPIIEGVARNPRPRSAPRADDAANGHRRERTP